MERKEFEYWSKHSDLIVKQSEFDKSIYITIYSRNDGGGYFSSQQLAVRLNNSKVIILDKRCKKIMLRNFKMVAEVI